MSIIRSACDVQDGVRVTRVLFQFFDCFNRRQDQEFDLAAIGFSLHFLHDRQGAASCADHEACAFPRYLLFERERRVAELLAEFLGRLLVALAHLSAVDHHVMVIGDTVDAEGAEGEPSRHSLLSPADGPAFRGAWALAAGLAFLAGLGLRGATR